MDNARRIIKSPLKYVQGAGEIENLAAHYKALGNKKAFLILCPVNYSENRDIIVSSFEKENIPYEVAAFGGECSKGEIKRLQEMVKSADVIVGVGGGKAIDVAKAVAYYLKLPVIIVPTLASTDAPCSAVAVLYSDDGVFDETIVLDANPNCVVVDTEIISKAPVRLLVAGMGDALATYFEARASCASNSLTRAGGVSSVSAQALAKLSYDILIADGLVAKCAVEAGEITPAVENIIEANTFLSGVGFESGGLGAAHSVHNGLTVLPEAKGFFHGEKVAFGVLVQLVLENADDEEIATVFNFCKSVGLPTSLAQLNITDVTPEKLMAVATASCAEKQAIHNMPFPVSPEMVRDAIIKADKLGEMLT